MNTLGLIAAFGIVCIANSISLDKTKRQWGGTLGCYECSSADQKDCITFDKNDNSMKECYEGYHCYISYIKKLYYDSSREWYVISKMERGCVDHWVSTMSALAANGSEEHIGYNCFSTGCNDERLEETGDIVDDY